MYYEVAWQSWIKAKFDLWWKQQDGTYQDSDKFHQCNLFILKEFENEPVLFREEIRACIEVDHQFVMEEWKNKNKTLKTDNTKDGEEWVSDMLDDSVCWRGTGHIMLLNSRRN